MTENNQTLSIGELSDRTGMTPDALRYYERVGLMTDVPRQSNGHRVYGDHHARWVGMLQRLRAVGMPIARMAEYVALARDGAGTLQARVELLEGHRAELRRQMAELETFFEILERKIQLHRNDRPGADCLQPSSR